jgi:hypothetical protein
MEAAKSSKTSVSYRRTVGGHNEEDLDLYIHIQQNLIFLEMTFHEKG